MKNHVTYTKHQYALSGYDVFKLLGLSKEAESNPTFNLYVDVFGDDNKSTKLSFSGKDTVYIYYEVMVNPFNQGDVLKYIATQTNTDKNDLTMAYPPPDISDSPEVTKEFVNQNV